MKKSIAHLETHKSHKRKSHKRKGHRGKKLSVKK